jgi:hypothetical protein
VTAGPAAHKPLIPDDQPSRIRLGLIAGGSALALIGSMMSWVSGNVAFAGHISVGGFDGDGKFTALLAVVSACLGVYYFIAPSSGRLAALTGSVALLTLLAVYEIFHVSSKVDEANDALRLSGDISFGDADPSQVDGASSLGHFSVGAGLWVLIFGAAVAAVGVILTWRRFRVGSAEPGAAR